MTPPLLDPVLGTALGLALAGIWLRAVAHKGAAPRAFRAAVAGYGLLPAPLVGVAAWGLGLAELGVALALLAPVSRGAGALASAVLLALYGAAMAVNLVRGRRDLDCGCAGPGAGRPLGEGLLLRNGLLIACSGLAALPPGPRSLGWLDGFTVVVGAMTLLLLYAGAEAALANAPRSRSLGRRAWSTR